MLTPAEFRSRYEQYMGPAAPLPLVLSASDEPVGEVRATHGCIFKVFDSVQAGTDISLDGESINCMGGKFYCGFSPARPQMFDFVSRKEKYKASPECVADAVENMEIPPCPGRFLNFRRLDRLEEFTACIGLIFLVTPDLLAGLFAWANYDQPNIHAVQCPWGSGCAQTVSALVRENARGGKHCFIGLLDISARPWFSPDTLSFSIPLSRFAEMGDTLSHCCLASSPAWEKLRRRGETAPGQGTPAAPDNL